ncbi:hypothetical protein MIMGU_mgv1a017315mg [Erythranthe guttata]|uniref:Uncharacterized protein n=1 Tax=Erythranthe guttata TaxID=4155 RepID=A0A022RZR0_ERYGU|nr:PREDICTED: uncharacterized protein LOC105975659 [Erythranthe guttata]EYU44440.1 hypothetical protein MIMGU_mgv1a017315mg [Erythranthe guttata]|eukprot:XP_012856315.1 PREDICTED: uncharacterized protein LOC105975659 [Erythranthe guttata]
MSASANKATSTRSGQWQPEKTVESVDIYSSAGQGHEQMQPVKVLHQPHSAPAASNTSGSILSNAAASVESTLQSAKDAISRK